MTRAGELVGSCAGAGIVGTSGCSGRSAAVPRELFVPDELRGPTTTRALPIGHGQTISQPFMVAAICGAARARGAERVLDVGTGSGYQAAVLAELAAEVVTIERVPELAEQARRRSRRPATTVEVRVGDGTLGVAERAPFERSRSRRRRPRCRTRCYDQLAPGAVSSSRSAAAATSGCEIVVRGPDGPARRSGRSLPVRAARRRGRIRRAAGVLADPGRC